jgi:hypothetical protein
MSSGVDLTRQKLPLGNHPRESGCGVHAAQTVGLKKALGLQKNSQRA